MIEKNPIGVHPYAPPRDWRFWNIVAAWTDGIELFILAHEYGHLIHARDSASVLRDHDLLHENDSIEDPVTSELAADRFALKVVWRIHGIARQPWLAAFGPLVFLWFLARLEAEAEHLLRGPNHPTAPARLLHAEDMVSEPEDSAIWAVMKRRLDAAWSIAGRAVGVVPQT